MATIENEVKNLKENNSVEHRDIKDGLSCINKKLDDFADKKADKEQFEKVDDRFWQIIVAIVVAFIGLIVTAIKAFLGKV